LPDVFPEAHVIANSALVGLLWAFFQMGSKTPDSGFDLTELVGALNWKLVHNLAHGEVPRGRY
jgi:hypothetical protein